MRALIDAMLTSTSTVLFALIAFCKFGPASIASKMQSLDSGSDGIDICFAMICRSVIASGLGFGKRDKFRCVKSLIWSRIARGLEILVHDRLRVNVRSTSGLPRCAGAGLC